MKKKMRSSECMECHVG